MVHNGIEYALMAAYAEGFNLLAHANIGAQARPVDAETTPLRHPDHYRYDFALADVAEVWRRGSVVRSWLLDLTAEALAKEPDLQQFSSRVADSGAGRWTAQAAIETGTPAPVLTAALAQRFSSRGESDFADRLLSAMRFQFGGHR
jgi:6-phosphogluconate dehydrogenase